MTPLSDLPAVEHCADGVYRCELESVTHAIKIALRRYTGHVQRNRFEADEIITRNSGSRVADGRTVQDMQDATVRCPERFIRAIEEAKQAIEENLPTPTRKRRKRKYNQEDGEELCPQAWLERKTDGWTVMQRTKRLKNVVTIAVNCSVLVMREPEDLLWRGAMAAALADALTDRGHSVEIIAFACSDRTAASGKPSHAIHRLPIKLSSQPMDIGAVAVALCDIAFYRLIMLPVRARTLPYRIDGGFGRTTSLPARERDEFDIVIDSDVLNLEQATTKVEEYTTNEDE